MINRPRLETEQGKVSAEYCVWIARLNRLRIYRSSTLELHFFSNGVFKIINRKERKEDQKDKKESKENE